MIIYLAGPLFTQAERTWNRELATQLEASLPGAKVLLPQDFKPHARYNDRRHFGEVYKLCVKGLDDCHAVVAILDGPDSDSGTAWEVGYAAAKGRPIIGIRTDYRPSQEQGVNLMLSRSCARIVSRASFDEQVGHVARDVARILARTLKPKPPK
ncbi:MAG: nucleoside 2-deoxyribosyltransferase [Planctomycetota bacterium]|nr:nucleoside 2-deoxyribosyltransferase [Planctomycetota bacterium]